MQEEYKEIVSLIERYFEGLTTLEEEKRLQSYFQRSDVPADLQTYRAQLGFLADYGKEQIPEGDEWLFARIPEAAPVPGASLVPQTSEAPGAPGPARAAKAGDPARSAKAGEPRSMLPFRRIAAALLILATGFMAGRAYPSHKKDAGSPAIVEENTGGGKNTPDIPEGSGSFRYARMEGLSASERLQWISQVNRLASPDRDVLAALLYTLNADNNSNVRLAALEALAHWNEEGSGRQEVKRWLATALRNQKDPGVQIAIIDMLVSLRVRSAIPQIQMLAGDPATMDIVKTKARESIARLL